jgi:hypothetical protein
MRTPLEIAIQLDELLKRSKPFRNFNEVFGLTAELISTLSPSEAIIEETVVEEPVVEEVVEEVVVDETQTDDLIVEEPTIEEETVTEESVAKTTKKSKK